VHEHQCRDVQILWRDVLSTTSAECYTKSSEPFRIYSSIALETQFPFDGNLNISSEISLELIILE
jgi:hypothetical protein